MQYMCCPNCGNTIPTTTQQCPNCGTQFSRCLQCGKIYLGLISNCPNCGNKIRDQQVVWQANQPTMQQPANQNFYANSQQNVSQQEPKKTKFAEGYKKFNEGYKKYKKVKLWIYGVIIVVLGIIYLLLEYVI